MKKLYLLFFFLTGLVPTYSQQMGMSLGLSSKLFLPLDIHYAGSNGFGIKFNFSNNLNKGTEGEDYTSTINWDQFPEDHVKNGAYYTTYDLGLGKYFENFYVLGMLGLARETLFRNCFDDFHILGDNGYYYKQTAGSTDINIGAEIGLIKNNFLFGIHATRFTGIGIKIGYAFDFY